MKNNKSIIVITLLLITLFFSSCEDSLELEIPNYMLASKTVFTNSQTAESALQGIFNQLFNTSFANGGSQSVSFLGALSADTYRLTRNSQDFVEFNQNQITIENRSNYSLWSGAYNIIYQANALLEGVNDNTSLPQDLSYRIEGSSKFIRAFTYFYLVNLYGDVPLILGTDYQQNSVASRTSTATIYEQIVRDLEEAALLLEDNYKDGERTQVNHFAALAMLARVHLFLGNWSQAANYSSKVIEASDYYEILNNPDEVFLANSREAIWQISPIGWGNNLTHTQDGNILIKTSNSFTSIALSESLLNSFSSSEDKRYESWIGAFATENDTVYFPHKYKIQYDASGGPIVEYSMVLRLAEQYLIRAEAKARLGETSGAIDDLNKIKERAGVAIIDPAQNSSTASELLEEILLERRHEFFSEWGHRWFDLQRFGLDQILEDKPNSNWTMTSRLFPIPATEILRDPNLTQNPGY